MPQQTTTPNTQLLTAIGTQAIAYAWRATQQAFIINDTNTQITSMQLLAATTGDPTITKEFTQWKQDLQNNIMKKQTRIPQNKAETYLIYTKIIQPYIQTETQKMYQKLIETLRKKGLIEFTNTNTAKPQYLNIPRG